MLEQGMINNLFGATGAHLSAIKHDDRTELLCDLPGVKKEDIEISFDNNLLKIKATRKQPEDILAFSEAKFGEIHRSIEVSNKFDKKNIKAKMEDGVLAITLPRVKESLPTKIKIT